MVCICIHPPILNTISFNQLIIYSGWQEQEQKTKLLKWSYKETFFFFIFTFLISLCGEIEHHIIKTVKFQ